MSYKNLGLKNLSIALTIIAIVFTTAVIGQTMLITNNKTIEDAFSKGVVISQVNVGGLTKEEAKQSVGAYLGQKIKDLNLTLSYEDKVWNFTAKDFAVKQNVTKVINEAYDYQAKKVNNEKVKALKNIEAKGMKIDVPFKLLFTDIERKLGDVINQIEYEPINASVNFDPDRNNMFKYKQSKEGKLVNRDKLYKDLELQFKEDSSNMNIVIETVKVPPKITTGFLQDKTNLISEFYTSLHNSKERRLHNVRLAMSKFNGLTVKPNETISFNALTSPQTLEGGYRKSIIIFNGVFVEGVGGGLCQASTTLYNAALLADLEILEANKHTLPVGYVELAFDAMVSENWSDFIFKNNSPNNLYIKCGVENNEAYAKFYGKTLEDGVKLKRRSEFVKTIPHMGDKIKTDTNKDFADKVKYKNERFRVKFPREGYEAKGYIQYYKNGKLIDEKKVRHEVYEPQPGLIVEGEETPPEDYLGNADEIEEIPPQNSTSNTTGSNVSSVLLEQNPTNYNP